MTHRPAIVLLLIATLAGCASHRPAPAKPSTQPATQPSKAELHLDQIPGLPEAPAPLQARFPEPPLEAIELFARARGELLAGRRFAAIGLLDKAIQLDPHSYELYYALGEAHSAPGGETQKALDAYQEAVGLRPESIEARLALARQFITLKLNDQALGSLRQAMQTPGYRQGGADAIMVDLLLGRVLHQEGYEQAALDQFQRVLDQIDPPNPLIRGNRELMFLAAQPEIVQVQIAELALKRGDTPRAIRAMQAGLEESPQRFDLHALLLRTIATTDDRVAFDAAARDLLNRFHATEQTMKLLRETYATQNRADALIDDLKRLHDQQGDDQQLMLALVNELQNRDRNDEAENILADAARRNPADTEVLRRLVASLEHRGAVIEAAKWLIESAAAEPGLLRQTSGLWSALLQVSRKDRLRLVDVRDMPLPPAAEGARWFWVSRLAELWNRQFASREALQKSVDQPAVFPPAYRLLAVATLNRDDIDDGRKAEVVLNLSDRARQKGDTALAYELRAMLRLHQKKTPEALSDLAAAISQGPASPELQLTYADALLMSGDVTKAEQILWKLVDEHPTFEDAYQKLFGLYVQRKQPTQAVQALQAWLTADPGSIPGRLLQAVVMAQGRQTDAAERLLIQLFNEAGDNEEILGTLGALYLQSGRAEQWIKLLETDRAKHPANPAVVQRLVFAYDQMKRPDDAAKVLDEARAAAVDQPDVLYALAHLYGVIDRKAAIDQTLEQVIALDPLHAPASNDLGYSWADQGIRLDEAEKLIRIAVAAEPDNHAYLDSLAWVLYKRGEFDEARKYLEQALSEAMRPDPVVIDHLADVLYRLGDKDAAKTNWTRARELVIAQGAGRDDLRELRLNLDRKLSELEKGEKVTVAPVAAEK